MADRSPDVAVEWHPTKNHCGPQSVYPNNPSVVWWSCTNGHEEEESIARRYSRGGGCLFGSNYTVLPGFNDFATVHPELLVEWDAVHNAPLKPSDLAFASSRDVQWICAKGHRWRARPYHRHQGLGCPICSGQTVLAGFNDLTTTHPELAAWWDPADNDREPTQVSAGSDHKAGWFCAAGHHWEATVSSRVAGRCCPYCSNKKVLVSFNDLATLVPELAAEWHPTLNGDRRPTDFVLRSDARVYWRCAKGHEWRTAISKRTRADGPTGCPYCTNKKVLAGFNDLATTHPSLVTEWDGEANGERTPWNVTAGCCSRVHWICRLGHRWRTSVAHRTRPPNPTGCRVCAKAGSSKSENALRQALCEHPAFAVDHPDRPVKVAAPFAMPDGQQRDGMRVDILARHPGTGTAIVAEYDGEFYHRAVLGTDAAKTEALLRAGFRVVRVREHPLPLLPVEHAHLLQIRTPWAHEFGWVATQVDFWLHGHGPKGLDEGLPVSPG